MIALCATVLAACGSDPTAANTTIAKSAPVSDPSSTVIEATTTRPDPPAVVSPTITTLVPGPVATTRVPVAAKVAVRPVQGSAIDIAFRDTERGWMLGSTPNCVGCPQPLVATTDGGASWSRVPSPSEGAASSFLRLRATHDGELWLFDVPGSPLNASALWESPDAGVTWFRTNGLARISDLAVGPTTAWALTDACDISATNCVTSIVRSNDRGVSWQRVETPLSLLQKRNAAQLIVVDDEHVIVLTQRTAPDGHDIVSTDDGGRHWTTLASVGECGKGRPQLAAVDARQLWLACSGDAAIDMEHRVVARSDDGGRHWHIVLDAIVTGHVAQVWAISPSKAYISQCRGPVIVTTDGGATWAAAGEFQISGERCISPVVFAHEQHGYAGDTKPDGATRIWRTADAGRSWQPVDVD
jgi:photosystem II stability/assembly factor-like uncharacterized protein